MDETTPTPRHGRGHGRRHGEGDQGAPAPEQSLTPNTDASIGADGENFNTLKWINDQEKTRIANDPDTEKHLGHFSITREENYKRTAEAEALMYADSHPEMSRDEAIAKGYEKYNARHKHNKIKTDFQPEKVAEQKSEPTGEPGHGRTGEARHDRTGETRHERTKESEKTHQTHFVTPDGKFTWDRVMQKGKTSEITVETLDKAGHKVEEKFAPVSDEQKMNWHNHGGRKPSADDVLINKDGNCLAKIGDQGQLRKTYINKDTAEPMLFLEEFPNGNQSATYRADALNITIKQDFGAKRQDRPSDVTIVRSDPKTNTVKSTDHYVPTNEDRQAYKGPEGALFEPVYDDKHKLIEMKRVG